MRQNTHQDLHREPARQGLNGHNTFEGDTSLTRADYYLNDGDNFSFQGQMCACTLLPFTLALSDLVLRTDADMKQHAEMYGKDGRYDPTSLAIYRSLRYNQSRADVRVGDERVCPCADESRSWACAERPLLLWTQVLSPLWRLILRLCSVRQRNRRPFIPERIRDLSVVLFWSS